MITTENLTTSVRFGNEEKANILVRGEYRKLILQVLAKPKKIGDGGSLEDAHELPKVEVDFFDVKSIDVLIQALQHIKENFNPPPEDTYALAC